MTALQEIQELYDKWVRLTREEGVSITSADWPETSRLQAAKAELQKQINKAHENLARQNPEKIPVSPFRRNLGRLISLENQNGEHLKSQHQRLLAERRDLEISQKNLHRIRSSYASDQPTNDWQCVS